MNPLAKGVWVALLLLYSYIVYVALDLQYAVPMALCTGLIVWAIPDK